MAGRRAHSLMTRLVPRRMLLVTRCLSVPPAPHHSFDAADARRDACLGKDLEAPDLRRIRHVSAPAQLHRHPRDINHAHHVRVPAGRVRSQSGPRLRRETWHANDDQSY